MMDVSKLSKQVFNRWLDEMLEEMGGPPAGMTSAEVYTGYSLAAQTVINTLLSVGASLYTLARGQVRLNPAIHTDTSSDSNQLTLQLEYDDGRDKPNESN